MAHAGIGHYEQGISYGERTLELHRQTENPIGQAHTLHSLGQCYARLSQHHDAVAYFQQALDHCRDIGDRQDEATNLRRLARACARSARPIRRGSTGTTPWRS